MAHFIHVHVSIYHFQKSIKHNTLLPHCRHSVLCTCTTITNTASTRVPTSSSRPLWSPAQIEMVCSNKGAVASIGERSYDQPTSVAKVLILVLDCGIGDPSNTVGILPVVPAVIQDGSQ